MNEAIPLPVLALYRGQSERTIRRRANDGDFGPVSAPPGHVNRRTINRREFEKRYGAMDEARLARAWALYRHAEFPNDDATASEDAPPASHNKDRPHVRTR